MPDRVGVPIEDGHDGVQREGRHRGPEPARRLAQHEPPSALLEIARDGEDCFAMVRLETGRKHQIRAHVAAIGHPLRDDPLYDDRAAEGGKLLLRAMVLAFDHPRTKRRVRFVADWTKEFPDEARKRFAVLLADPGAEA